MTHEASMLLYRVQLRLSQEWGESLIRIEALDAPRDLHRNPFEATAWSDAIAIVDLLRHGFQAPIQFRSFMLERPLPGPLAKQTDGG